MAHTMMLLTSTMLPILVVGIVWIVVRLYRQEQHLCSIWE